MEFVAAVAIGLNPYVGTLVLATLAAFTRHAPLTGAVPLVFALSPAVATLAALAVPVDLVFSNFVRYVPRVRACAHVAAPLASAGAALLTTQSDVPPPLVAAGGAGIAWAVAVLLTAAARRASRSPAWVGLGHVPVLMGATTLAACLVPLALVRVQLGLVPAVSAVIALLYASASGLRLSHAERGRRAKRLARPSVRLLRSE